MEYTLGQSENLYDFETPTTSLIPALNRMNKEMAAYAALLTSQQPEQAYQEIVSEMENTGRSQYIDSLVQNIKVDEDVQRREAMANIIADPALPKEDKYNALMYYQQNKDVLPSLRDKYITAAATVYTGNPLDPRAFAQGFFDKEIGIANQQAVLNKTAATWDDSTWAGIGGFLIEVTPFVGTTLKGIQFTEALDALEKKERPAVKKVWDVISNGIFQGSAAEEIRDKIAALPTAEARTDAVRRILKATENVPGMDFNQWTFNMMALEGDMANWEKYLYNGLGILGAAFGAGTLTTLAGRITKSGVTVQVDPKSVLGSTAAHNPTIAGTMLGKAVLDETGQVAAALGANRAQTVGSMLPKVDQEVTNAIGPEFNQAVHNILNPLDEEGKAMLALTERSAILFTDEAKSALNKVITGRIEDTKSAALHLGKSSVQFAEQIGETTTYGAKGVAVFGKTSDTAFASYDEALAIAKDLSGELPEGVVTIAKVDSKSGRLLNVGKGADKTEAGILRDGVNITEEVVKTPVVKNPVVFYDTAEEIYLTEKYPTIVKSVNETIQQLGFDFRVELREKITSGKAELTASKKASGHTGIGKVAGGYDPVENTILLSAKTIKDYKMSTADIVEFLGHEREHGKQHLRGDTRTLLEREKEAYAVGRQTRELFIERSAKGESTGINLTVGKQPEMAQGAGEYYLRYVYNKNLNPEDIPIFGPDAVRVKFDLFGRENKLLSDMFTKIAKSGRIGNYFFAHQMLPKTATDVAFSAYDKALRVEDQFLGYARKYIAGQSSADRKFIAQLLDEGEKFRSGSQIGKVFTYDEVVQKAMAQGSGLRHAQVSAEGYFTYRRLSDWMYTMLDREKSAEFSRGGFLWHGTGEGRFVGKSITEEAALKDVRAAMDKMSNTMQTLTPKAIRELYKGGGSIVRLGQHIRNGDDIIEYAKVGAGTPTAKISQGALPYVRAWVPRFYDNNYFVVRTPKSVVVNGIKITDPQALKGYRTAHFASDTHNGALFRSNELNKSDPSGIYDVKMDRLDVKTMLTIADISRAGFVNAAHRGLEAVPGGTLSDPLEGLMKVIQSTSKTAAMSDFLAASKADFIRQYGNFLTERGVFPGSKEGLRLGPNATKSEVEEFQNAKTVYDWLEGMLMLQRYDSAIWKNLMYGVGEFAEKFSPAIASVARLAGKHYPVDTLRKMASTLFISMRPARQILLQPSQLMLLASIDTSLLNPLKAYRFANDIGALNLAHLYKSVSNRVLPAEVIEKIGAKTMGISKEEYIKRIEQLKSSGLLQSVDMNTLLDGMYAQHGKKLISTKVEDVTNTIGGFAKGVTFNYGRAIGFDRGEQWNLIGSWIVARNRYQRMHPDVDILSKQATEQIAADTREMTFSMTRPGSFAYQKNAFALPLQFMAAPHKAFLNFTTNKVWTPAEKARLMASSFVLYGSAGVGMLWVMDDLRQKFGTDLSPEQWKLLEGGVLDWGLNSLVNMFVEEGGQKSELDFTRSFSPTTHLPFTEFLIALTEKPFADVILGPSWSVIDPENGRIARAIRDIAMIQKRDPITKDNFKDSLWRATEIASGGSDLMKYRLARNLQWHVTTNGALIDEQATVAEAIGVLFGIQPSKARIYFEANKFIDQQDANIKDTAKLMHDSLLSVSRKYADSPDDFLNTAQSLNAYLNFETDESIVKAHAAHFNTLVRQSVTNQGESLHQNVFNGAQSRSQEQNRAIYNLLKSHDQNDAANRTKALIGEE